MKIKFIDINEKLVNKVRKAIPHFECVCDDIFNHKGVIVSASNPLFTFGGGLDALIANNYPTECKEKQSKKGGNERIGNIIFTITVNDNLKSSKELIRDALVSIMMYGKEDETILLSGLGTSIGGLSEEDFIEVLKDFFPNTAYKGMDKDMKCRNMQFEIGKIYKEDNAKLCDNGFHYCQKLENVYKYYDNDCRIFEIEILGQVDFGLDKDCSTSIKILKEIDNYGIKKYKSKSNNGNRNNGYLNNGNCNNGNGNNGDGNNGNCNNGDGNNGDRNNGNRNNGNRNNGNINNGYRNNGDRNNGNRNNGHGNNGHGNNGHGNNGHRNNGDYFFGHFNIGEPTFLMFGKKAEKNNISFPNYFYFDLTKWIYPSEMTVEEKNQYPLYGITNGYLKVYKYKEAWKLSFDKASKKEIEQTIEIQNFNYKIFEQITGITKKMIQDRLK